jgi:hypothetical protein
MARPTRTWFCRRLDTATGRGRVEQRRAASQRLVGNLTDSSTIRDGLKGLTSGDDESEGD